MFQAPGPERAQLDGQRQEHLFQWPHSQPLLVSAGIQAEMDAPLEAGYQQAGPHPFALHHGGHDWGVRSHAEHRAPAHAQDDPRALRERLAMNLHAGMQDNVKGILSAFPGTLSQRQPNRLRPEDLPAAGGVKRGGVHGFRPASARPCAAPFGQDGAGGIGEVFSRAEAQVRICGCVRKLL